MASGSVRPEQYNSMRKAYDAHDPEPNLDSEIPESSPLSRLDRMIEISSIPWEKTHDTLFHLFENKTRVGGGEIEHFFLLTQRHKAWVIFKEKEVAERVLKHVNAIQKKHGLKVSAVTTIAVPCSETTSSTEIEAYFKKEAKEHEAEVIDIHEEAGTVYIFFDKSQAASAFIIKGPHRRGSICMNILLPGEKSTENVPIPSVEEATQHSDPGLKNGEDEPDEGEYQSNIYDQEVQAEKMKSLRMGSVKPNIARSSEKGASDQGTPSKNHQGLQQEQQPQGHEADATMAEQSYHENATGTLPDFNEEPFGETTVVIKPEYVANQTDQMDNLRRHLNSNYKIKLVTSAEGTHTITGPWSLLHTIRSGLKEGKTIETSLRPDSCQVKSESKIETKALTNKPQSYNSQKVDMDETIWNVLNHCSGEALTSLEDEYKVKIKAIANQEFAVFVTGELVHSAKNALATLASTTEAKLVKKSLKDLELSSEKIEEEVLKIQSSFKGSVYVDFFPTLGRVGIYGLNSETVRVAYNQLKTNLGLDHKVHVKHNPDTNENRMLGPIQNPPQRQVLEQNVSSIEKLPKSALSTGVLFKRIFRNNIEVSVCHGDITAMKTDVIVNASNESLSHEGGVAFAISRVAGQALVNECHDRVRKHGLLKIGDVFPSRAGNLQCRAVFHAVGPRWLDAREKCVDILYQIFLNCLTMADDRKAQSIAIPALSSGVYGVPKPIVAKAIYEATAAFISRAGPHCHMKRIIYITIDPEVNSCITDAFEMEGNVQTHCSIGNSWRSDHTASGTSPGRGTNSSSSMLGQYSTTQATPAGWKQQLHHATPSPQTNGESGEACPICMDTMKYPKQLAKCGHKFCNDCIDKSFTIVGPKCPTCGEMYGALQGTQPLNATMNVTIDKYIHLPGFGKHCSTYVIDYYIPSGLQTAENPHPGAYYHGTTRKAYLPVTKEGTEILGLLQRAWAARLIFTIGRSTTTGRENVVTWNDIHHKTRIDGGPSKFGYPDPTYLKRVREELAAKGIR